MIPAGKPKHLHAQVYIGVIISIGVFLILSQAVVSLIFSSYDLIVFTRTRTTARFIAEEKLEIAKNLAYDDLGVVGGIPSGILEQSETILANGLGYVVSTRVDNIDDIFDGQGAADPNPADYKRITVLVSWDAVGASTVNSVSLTTDISPQTDIDTGGGTLDITVTDALGNPVPSAEVTLVASSINPPVNTTLTTDNQGKLIIPNSISCTACYEITTTKSGFSTDRTYGTDEVANPTKPDVTILEDQVSQINFVIDVLSELTINSTNNRASGFSVLPSQQFILRGNKIIGSDSSGTLIYKYAEILTTDGSGNLTVSNLEWDAYSIIIPTGVGWDVSGTNPLSSIVVNPAENTSVSFSSTPGSDHRLLAIFTDGVSPIASVAATLKENSGPFEASISSGLSNDPDFGQAFFANLTETTYTLMATMSGFLEYINSDVIVTDYTKEEVVLIPE